MKAITIRQPWAGCIAEGFKQVENRGRNVSYRGLIAIHTARAADVDADRDPRVVAMWGRHVRIGWPQGAVIAVATLADCHRAAQSPDGTTCCEPWGDRLYGGLPAYHLVLRDIFHLNQPVYVRGQQAVPWTLPADTAAEVSAQLRESS